MQMIPMALGALSLLCVLWVWLAHRAHQRAMLALQQEVEALQTQNQEQKTLIDTQMKDLTQQMVMQSALQERVQQAEKQVQALQQALADKEDEHHRLQTEEQQAKVRIGQLEMQLQVEQQAAADKLALLDEAKERMVLQFKALADQVLEEKGKVMHEENRRNLDAVLQPVREQLGVFRQRVDEIHRHDSQDRAALREHLKQLQQLNQKMSEDAINLTHALKGDSKVQGCWGEMILEKILESSGLREGHEFVREASFTGEDGRRLRPDVIIHMPGDKHIIIDAKVSLKDYERVIAAGTQEEKEAALKAHVRSLKSHIQGLSGKRYEHLPAVHSPDYVLMFMPIEGAYLMAIEADAGIFEEAFDKHIAVVTPSTLYATLKLVEQLWRYERQSENVVALLDRAGKLHDKMADFINSFEEIGQRLHQAQRAYDTSLKRMSTGSGNVVRQIDQLGKLAGKTKKELPEHLLVESGALSLNGEGET